MVLQHWIVQYCILTAECQEIGRSGIDTVVTDGALVFEVFETKDILIDHVCDIG